MTQTKLNSRPQNRDSVTTASGAQKMSLHIYRSENHDGITSALEKMTLNVSGTQNHDSVTEL